VVCGARRQLARCRSSRMSARLRWR
jgi:hypothetical protein